MTGKKSAGDGNDKTAALFNPNAKARRYLRCIGNGDLSWASGWFYAAPYHVVREDVILVL